MSPIGYTFGESSFPRKITYYKDPRGRSPFLEWLEKLSDRVGRAKIKIRMDRLERGNLGDCRSVGQGIYEIKIHEGPGYRVYFGFLDPKIIVIFCGGSKQTQKKDIEKAKQYMSFLKEAL